VYEQQEKELGDGNRRLGANAMHLACVQKNAQDGDDGDDDVNVNVVEVFLPPRKSEKLEA